MAIKGRKDPTEMEKVITRKDPTDRKWPESVKPTIGKEPQEWPRGW